jgi:hypothetical protein
MRISKKLIVIGVACVVVLAGTVLGGVAIANAADSDTTTTTTTTTTAQANLWDKVAEMYQKDTGTAIDPAALQKAFQEAGSAVQADKMDQMLQKLVDSGKITQEQADQWKAWWNSRPSSAISDEFKTWLESRPEIPGLGVTGIPGKNMMPFNGKGMMPFGKMGRFNVQGNQVDPDVRGFCPNINN